MGRRQRYRHSYPPPRCAVPARHLQQARAARGRALDLLDRSVAVDSTSSRGSDRQPARLARCITRPRRQPRGACQASTISAPYRGQSRPTRTNTGNNITRCFGWPPRRCKNTSIILEAFTHHDSMQRSRAPLCRLSRWAYSFGMPKNVSRAKTRATGFPTTPFAARFCSLAEVKQIAKSSAGPERCFLAASSTPAALPRRVQPLPQRIPQRRRSVSLGAEY